MLDVRRLRLLLELSQRGTLAATARALGYSPSAVSQQLTALEREVGAVLLERDGRGVTLTAAAHALVRRTRRVIDELEAAEAELEAVAGLLAGVVRIAAFPTAIRALVAPAAGALRAAHPDIRLQVREADPEEGLELLRAGAIDLIIAYQYDLLGPLSDGGMVRLDLLQDPVRVALPAAHPLARARSVALTALRDDEWVTGLPGTPFGLVVHRVCRHAGFEPRIVHRASEFGVQEALVASGIAVALLPELGRDVAVDDVAFVALERPAPTRHVFAVLRRGTELRPTVSATTAALSEVVARRGRAR